jgi:hypothetical protein
MEKIITCTPEEAERIRRERRAAATCPTCGRKDSLFLGSVLVGMFDIRQKFFFKCRTTSCSTEWTVTL